MKSSKASIGAYVAVAAFCTAVGWGAAAAFAPGAPEGPVPHAVAAEKTAPKGSSTPRAPIEVVAKLGPEESLRLRSVIREELQAMRTESEAAAANDSEGTEAEAPAEPVAPEHVPIFDRAQGVVEEAVRRGSWSENDRDEFRVALGRVPDEMRQDLIRQLVLALNQQKLDVEFNGAPF